MTKTCLLTGASGGIGQAMAKALAKNGYQLILQGRNEIKLTALKNELGEGHSVFVGDLTEPSVRATLIETVCANGPLDLLVNNAGVSLFAEFCETSYAQIEQLFQLNVLATMDLCQKAIASAGANPLTIVNVGSVLGAIGHPGYSAYCAAKFALKGFSEALSREYTKSNIAVKYLAPRATDTELNSDAVNAMNKSLGNNVDSPELVASALIKLITSTKTRQTIGWPERLFVRVNGVLPEVVDNAIGGKLKKIKQFTNPNWQKQGAN